MKKNLLLLITFGLVQVLYAQNIFPIYSNGNYSGGSGDYTNVSNAQLKLQASSGYIRIPHISFNSTISTVYNFQTNKNVYWGEPSDLGSYFFRGRDLIVEQGNIGIGTSSPSGSISSNETGLHILNDNVSYLSLESTAGSGKKYTMYSSTEGSLVFWDASLSTTRGKIDTDGNWGIGMSNPTEKLDVAGVIAVGESSIENRFKIWSGGTGASNHMRIGTDFGHYGDAVLELYQNYSGGDSQNPGKLIVNGNLGVGTVSTGTHRLAVEGSIGARKINVEASGWSDFVFESDYELKTLEEVEQHIDENGHLPDIPSEAEVTESGINLGDMDAKLLMKIEELTLYLIEQNKQNQAQQLQLESQAALIEQLKNKVSALEN